MRLVYSFVAVLFMSVAAVNAGVFKSTSTADNNLRRNICSANDRGYLHRICIVDSVTASTMTVYNSSWTSVDSITGGVDGNNIGCFNFEVGAPQGLYMVTWGTATYTVIYDCYR